MAGKLDDLDIPKALGRTATQSTVPGRVTDLSRPNAAATEPVKDSGLTPIGVPRDPAEPRTMIVGREITLSGDIKSCNKLIVQGSVEATLHDCRQMEISQGGLFKGNASIDEGEVSGHFEGELVVGKRLLIRSTGHVSGTITYGQIEIERGGKVSGTVRAHDNDAVVPNLGIVRAGE